MVSCAGVSRTYTRGGEELRVLDGLDLEVPDGFGCWIYGDVLSDYFPSFDATNARARTNALDFPVKG